MEDISLLIKSLQSIVDKGHSLFVIEHHSHILAQADWIIELGPGAGKDGGKISSVGTPSQISKLQTPTGIILSNRYRNHSTKFKKI